MPNTKEPRAIFSRFRPSRRSLAGFLVGVLCGGGIGLTMLIHINPPPTERTEQVFIYGTLLNPYIRNIACLCQTSSTPVTLPHYEKVGRNIVPQENSVVYGAVIQVSSRELRRLDRYEKVPRKYRREQITIAGDDYWVYRLNF